MHPNGQLPAYEWAFGDVNPPVHAWAALRGLRDRRRCDRLRVPGADLPQAAAELHLVGQPQGRRGQQRLRGRLPRPRQHRPARPVGDTAGRRRLEQSDGTAWMGMYCPQPAGDGPRPRRPRRHLRRPRHQVLRALRLHRLGHPRPRPVGRGGRLLLRRPPHRRRHPAPVAGAVDGGPPPAVRHDDAGRSDAGPAARLRRSLPLVRRAQAGVRRPTSPTARPGMGSEGRLLAMVDPDRLRRILATHARRGRVPLAPRSAGAGRQPPGAPVLDRPGRHRGEARRTSASTTSRASRPPACSAATRTGGARSGSRSTTW